MTAGSLQAFGRAGGWGMDLARKLRGLGRGFVNWESLPQAAGPTLAILNVQTDAYSPSRGCFWPAPGPRDPMRWFRRICGLGRGARFRARHPTRYVVRTCILPLSRTAALASAAAEALGNQRPARSDQAQQVADYCTICASIHLTGLLTAEPPSYQRSPLERERLKVSSRPRQAVIPGFHNARAPLA